MSRKSVSLKLLHEEGWVLDNREAFGRMTIRSFHPHREKNTLRGSIDFPPARAADDCLHAAHTLSGGGSL